MRLLLIHKKKGSDITIISFSYMLIECLTVSKILSDNNIKAEVMNINVLNPLNIKNSHQTINFGYIFLLFM